MKAASLTELKHELKTLTPAQLVDLCLHLSKYKKENKELLTYLLFEADNEAAYVKNVKEMVTELFGDVNMSSIYLAKKTIRKILRITAKYIKYSGSRQTEAELLLFFCKQLNHSGIPIHTSQAMINLYQRQIQKIEKAIATMHEDLQYDYQEDIKELRGHQIK